MARIGKIARLSQQTRHQLNTRLADGHAAADILDWLNALPETKSLLAEKFDAHAISEQNLSIWRQTGHEEWLAHQEILAHAQDLAERGQELQTIAPGLTFTDHLAAALAFRYSAILAAQGLALDEAAIRQLRALAKTTQAVVKLRRADQNAARLKIETERWEIDRPNHAAQNDADLKRLQRDTLAAPVWATAKIAQNVQTFGEGPAGRFAMDYLREIETCPDPANFESKVLTSQTPEQLAKSSAEWEKKHPRTKPTAAQAAIAMMREFDQALDQHGNLKPAKNPRRKKSRDASPRRPQIAQSEPENFLAPTNQTKSSNSSQTEFAKNTELP